jgi:uncharacterized protein YndB with AHSA1/START domain
MKWAIVVLAVVVALALCIIAIGALLPRDHVASRSSRIPAPPDSVWAALTDYKSYPAWRPDVVEVQSLPPTTTGAAWREQSKQGVTTMVVDSADPPRRLVTRIADLNLPYGGTWEYRIDPEGSSSSVVTITERGSVYNPIFRFVSRFIMGHTATIDAFLLALGKRFGGTATPVDAAITGETHGL